MIAEGATPSRIFHTAGFATAMTLTCAAFAITVFPRLMPRLSLFFVLGLGVGQIIVHFVFFLRINLKKSVREDLLLILFSAFIIVVMVGERF